MAGGDWFGIIFGAVFVTFVCVTLYIIFITRKKATDELNASMTFSQYKEKYPDAVTSTGVSCKECGATDIFLQKIGFREGKFVNYHICKVCGTKLYKSTS